MYFLLERAKKIAKQLQCLTYSNKVRVERFYMKEGNFNSPEDVDSSNAPYKEFLSGVNRWGGRDNHAWFKTTVEIPREFHGKTTALYVSTGMEGWDATNPQFILYVDGQLVQGLDVNHREVIITKDAKAKDVYQVDLHAYGGMLDKKVDLFVDLVVVDEKVRKLYFDLNVPIMVCEKLPENDKKRIDMVGIINETINLIDLRKPYSELFYASIDKATAYLEEEFYGKMCGHEDVIATCVGHTHIDVAWLWTLGQTREKTVRSFSTVLKLMDEYPEYVFMSSQPQLYKFIKEDHPELYEKIRERIKEGRWEAEGAMWLEADCNISSGESLVRQVMFGTRFFEKEFGVKNRILWLPDVFGYSAALPQILKKSEIDYFMTTKISWNQFNKLPYDTFMWRGIDGTEILTHFITTKIPGQDSSTTFTTYNGMLQPDAIMGGWDRYQQKNINNDILIAYGYGDGGGGPTKEMLENGRRMGRGIPGCPKVKQGKAKDFFERLEKKVQGNKYLPKWVGELYLEYHRGTYTSMARNKKYNRKNELLYEDTEFLSSMAMILGKDYPQDRINSGWETILLNQFHDILPGSSIKEVYEESKEQYEGVLLEGRKMVSEALENIAKNIRLEKTSVVVYNTLSFDRSDVVSFDMPKDLENVCVIDEDGNKIPCQVICDKGSKKVIFFAKGVPSKGYKSYAIEEGKVNAIGNLTADEKRMENNYFAIDIDEKGTLTSIYDKVNNRQVLKEGEKGNRILAFEDKPMNFDNWDIDIFYREKMWEVDDVEKIEVVECGPVRAGIKIHKKFLDSVIVQTMYIYNDIPRVDFDTYIDWKEEQVLLKASFPVDVHADKATYEIQYGNVERPTHWNTSWDTARFEVCAHKWADLSEGGYGVSLLNDCKFGHDIKDGDMRLTLLKSGIEPNKEADKEEHYFTYSLYPHGGDWKDANTVQMAYSLNVPMYAKVEEAHDGVLPSKLSMVSVDKDNVVVEVIKKAEDSDDIVVRLYECHNKRTNVRLTFFKKFSYAAECNLMEKEIGEVKAEGDSLTFAIKPYEIKTFKLKLLP